MARARKPEPLPDVPEWAPLRRILRDAREALAVIPRRGDRSARITPASADAVLAAIDAAEAALALPTED